MSSGYWTTVTQSRFGRRRLLRGTALGAAGLAGVALLGCGSEEEASTPAATSGGGGGAATSAPTASTTNGAPANIQRAPGFDPSIHFGESAINTNEVVRGGTYRKPIARFASLADPELAPSAGDHQYVNDRLFYANGWTQELTPDLLESYEVTDPQGLEYILTLREGIKTHNTPPASGRIFNAEDVAWSIRRKAGMIVAPEVGAPELRPIRASHFDGLANVEAVDERRVRLTMDKPNGAMLASFAHSGQVMYPIEMAEIDFKGDRAKFVGTGAWIHKEFVDDSRQVFTANPEYYRSWDEGGRPGYDTFETLVIGDRGATVAAFITGDIHTITGVQQHEEAQIRASVPDALWYSELFNNWPYIGLNPNLPNLPFFKDKRVWKALRLSQDYKALGDGYAKEWSYSGPIPIVYPEALSSEEVKKRPGYNPDTKEKDIADALALLDAAGYPNGAGIAFQYAIAGASGSFFDLGIRVTENWAKAIPEMKVEMVPHSDTANFQNLQNTRTYEARTWSYAVNPDAALEARQYYHSTGSRNYEGWAEPWADEAIDKMMAAQSREERIEAIRPFEERYIDEGGPLITLFLPGQVHVNQSTVGGWDLSAGPFASTVRERWLWQTKKA